ncbi:MAG: DNA polymerase IV [Anaerolineae bacterium]|nr:DNA polymerase IV [Anaerolineae bacterium]
MKQPSPRNGSLQPTRTIIHLDLDAFFAAVEVKENPDLAGQPVLIGGRGRGVVATASYPARAFGIHSAMPMYQALQLCPQAVVLPPRHSLYRDYSRRVMAILHQAASLVEEMSIDEAYLDLTGRAAAWEDGVATADQLQQRVRDEVGLSASLGVATNKLVAKVASDQDKPGGLTVVRPGEEAAFLAPLPVRALWGVGPVTAQKLADIGVTTVGELAAVPREQLWNLLGRHGMQMARQAQGIDLRPVVAEHECKSVSQEQTFARDLSDPRALQRELWPLCQGVARRLSQAGMAAGTLAIKLRYADFTTTSRQQRLAVPTADARTIYQVAWALLRRAWQRGEPLRLLGVTGRDLCPPVEQPQLF